MFITRKTRKRAFHPLTMALTLVILLAMLVPAAAAAPEAPQAPEWVHGVALTYPTQQGVVPPSPLTAAFVNPDDLRPPTVLPYVEREGDNHFRVRFVLTIVGTQVDDVDIRVRAINANSGSVLDITQFFIATSALVTGANNITWPPLAQPPFFPENFPRGWYTLEVCARDRDNLNPPPGTPPRQWFCDAQPYALFIDNEIPGAQLIAPAAGAWLSGRELLVGQAWDPWNAVRADGSIDPLQQYGLPILPNGGVKTTYFQYCVISNQQPTPDVCTEDPQDPSWILIAYGQPIPNAPYLYNAVWNTTSVPDDNAEIRFCAEDFVGLRSCGPAGPGSSNAVNVDVNNSFTVNLRPGWNLVSTPVMLYNDDMETVLSHLHDPFTLQSYVKKVAYGYDPRVSNSSWQYWMPGGPAATFEHGQGYWIEMLAPASLTFVGAWKDVGAQSPPEYTTYVGWNLIGYTPWGTPTWFADRTVADYLQGPVANTMQALWRYNATTQTYVGLVGATPMLKGAGYWLATSGGGVIRP